MPSQAKGIKNYLFTRRRKLIIDPACKRSGCFMMEGKYEMFACQAGKGQLRPDIFPPTRKER